MIAGHCELLSNARTMHRSFAASKTRTRWHYFIALPKSWPIFSLASRRIRRALGALYRTLVDFQQKMKAIAKQTNMSVNMNMLFNGSIELRSLFNWRKLRISPRNNGNRRNSKMATIKPNVENHLPDWLVVENWFYWRAYHGGEIERIPMHRNWLNMQQQQQKRRENWNTRKYTKQIRYIPDYRKQNPMVGLQLA